MSQAAIKLEDQEGASAASETQNEQGAAAGAGVEGNTSAATLPAEEKDDGEVTVREMSYPEVYFCLDQALKAKKGASGANLVSKQLELQELQKKIGLVNKLASEDKFSVFTALKTDLEKWRSQSEDGGPPKRLSAKHIAMFTNLALAEPGAFLELCQTADERNYFNNDEIADIIGIVRRAMES